MTTLPKYNPETPHILQEGGVAFTLGKMKGDTIQYEFPKMLHYLSAKGKMLFGKKFKIYKEDYSMIYQLCLYFIKDKDNCAKFNIDINKGLLLSGPVGCGKTTLMKLLRYLVPHQRPYDIIPTRNIVFAFNNIGYSIIEQYGNNHFFCFDDLGVEPEGKHYGKDCNVIGEILLSRYERFINYTSNVQHHAKRPTNNNLTHITTNLNAEEIEDRYGNRVRSRLREMVNVIGFDKNTKDKRQ
ncbi:ATPase [Aequorivita marina]|uniref:ATPase n=1 Tax=Aequorivita marina TaxID=3073654 RepID=UPI00287715BA|nr:ATPase [Aequorivita sp. S2608]MDS1297875.1 ATPase [Aequorivita sp. S2608]